MRPILAAKVLLGGWLRTRPLAGPLSVQIGISDRCNQRCVMCWDHPPPERRVPGMHPASGRFMDLELFADLLADLQGLGVGKIRLIGRGEPLLHPRLPAILETVAASGLPLDITSNGRCLTPELARQLARHPGLKTLEVSLNAASGEVNRLVAGRPESGSDGEWNAMLNCLAEFHRHRPVTGRRPALHLSFVITRLNAHQVEDFAQLAAQLHAQQINYHMVQVHARSTDLLPTADQVRELEAALPRIGDFCRRHAIRHTLPIAVAMAQTRKEGGWSRRIHQQIPCYAGYYFAVILADGKVIGCCACDRALGNAAATPFSTIWHSRAYQAFRQQCFLLPRQQAPIAGCACYECGLARHNLSFHRVLHPWQAASLARAGGLYGLADLRQRF